MFLNFRTNKKLNSFNQITYIINNFLKYTFGKLNFANNLNHHVLKFLE